MIDWVSVAYAVKLIALSALSSAGVAPDVPAATPVAMVTSAATTASFLILMFLLSLISGGAVPGKSIRHRLCENEEKTQDDFK
ncbi:hypothetical protein [Nocardia arthritidis]|uniref:hypothetical protein n=1 Tax=Nocardia arthritidis TaxID=228602 RepID=UPI001FE1E5B0|nr:hypothetical protein [Nocardia arthritidis]